MNNKIDAPLSYRKAGVDTKAGQNFVSNIKSYIKKSNKPEVLGGIGGFAGLFKADFSAYNNPVLVSSTDGVGTKIELAKQSNIYRGLGRDLCAMCVNDILTLGAKPLFFLDYISTGKLKKDKLTSVVKGIVDGCILSDMSLLGGETAEHPGTMNEDDLDLAGFSIGLIDEENIIEEKNLNAGLKVIGLSSSGPHSNGFSLIRKILDKNPELLKENQFIRNLLSPTHIYTSVILPVLKKFSIKAMVHITGGGFYENIPRVLPDKLGVKINLSSWKIPEVFNKLAKYGPVEEKEMFSVFNMGIGFLLFVEQKNIQEILLTLEKHSELMQKEIINLLEDIQINESLDEESYQLLLTPKVQAYEIAEVIEWKDNIKSSHPLDDLETRIIFIN